MSIEKRLKVCDLPPENRGLDLGSRESPTLDRGRGETTTTFIEKRLKDCDLPAEKTTAWLGRRPRP